MHALGRTTLKITFKRNKFIQYKDLCQFPFINVHSPYEFPGEYDDDSSSKFYYGQDLDVLITPDVIKSDDDLRLYPPEKRNCYFQGEKPLQYFKVYTRKNCEMECMVDYYLQLNETKCVPYYLIRNESTPVCQLEKAYEVVFQQFYFFQTDPHERQRTESYISKCGCLDTCNQIKYSINVFESKLKEKLVDVRESQYARGAYDDNATVTITLKFNDDTYLPLVRRIAFTFSDFLCQAGGLLGLYAGISVLSIIELGYFCSLRPVSNLFRWLKEKLLRK